MDFQRLAGIGGLGFATSVITANLVPAAVAGPPPGVSASATEVAAYFAEHGDAARFGSAVAPIAWCFLVLFAAGAYRRLNREADGGWSLVGVMGAVMLIVLFASVVSSQIALIDGASVWSWHNAVFGVNAVGIGVAVTGFSMAGLKTGFLPRWHASIGLLSGALSVTGAVVAPWAATTVETLGAFGFAGFGLWILWIILTGIRLLRSAIPAPVALRTATAA